MSQRREQRVSVRLPVSIGGRAAALSADISHAGFCLESPKLLEAGVEVTGYVLHGHKELPWAGRVSWAEAGNPMMSTWHRMGIQFTKVSPGLRALLSMKQRG